MSLNLPLVTMTTPSHRCDGCHLSPIRGSRFRCLECEDYDLCADCRAANCHPQHEMVSEENSLKVVENDKLTHEIIEFYDAKSKQFQEQFLKEEQKVIDTK